MIGNLTHWWLFRYVAIAVIVAMVSMIPAESGFAQMMPRPGQIMHETPRFAPMLMNGIRVDVRDPFNLYFVMSDGDHKADDAVRRVEYKKLIKYFMASLITPNTDMWVNLSPQEAHRIIPDNFSITEMGRDMLAQDYLLKQFTASLMDPKSLLGKEFWDKVYQNIYEIYGTTQIAVDTFNKVWITADKADIYQKDDTAILVKSHLKVMLEQDFMTVEPEQASQAGVILESGESLHTRQMVSDIVRKIIIPVIEQEVNEGANFAQLRQIYNSMILATWFKKTLRDSLLGQVYADTSKVAGIELNDPEAKERIYQQYLEAYKTGVFNYIQEELDEATQEVLPRHYFAGGIVAVDPAMIYPNAIAYDAAQLLGQSGPVNVTSVTLQTPENIAFMPQGREQQNKAQASRVVASLTQVENQLSDSNTRLVESLLDVAQLKTSIDRAQQTNVDASMVAWFQRAMSRALLFIMLGSTVSPSLVNAADFNTERAAQQLMVGAPNLNTHRGRLENEAAALAREIARDRVETERILWEIEFSKALKSANAQGEAEALAKTIEPVSLTMDARSRAAWAQEKGVRLIHQDQVVLPSDRLLQASTVPVAYTPDALAVANVDYELRSLMRLVTSQKKNGPPVSLMFLGSNNVLDISTAVGLGQGWSMAVVPDLPFRNVLSGIQIGNGLSNFQAQSSLNQFAGPLFGAQLLADFGNWLVKHPVQGQDIMYDTSGKGLFATLLLNTTGITAYKDDGSEYKTSLSSVGLVDTYAAIMGQLDKYLLGDNGLMGDSAKSFPFEDAGFVVEIGSYHEGFMYGAALNNDPNVFAVNVFEVVDDTTSYKRNASGGWDKVSGDGALDEFTTYRQAKVTGVLFRYGPEKKELSGHRIFTGPTFVTDHYVKAQSHANRVEFRTESGNKKIFFQRQFSIEDLLKEKELLKGMDRKGRIVLGALRNPVTGRILEMITDPRRLNELSSLTDGDGVVVRFLPGKEFQDSKNPVGGYLLSQIMPVYQKWRNAGGWRSIAQDYRGKDITDSRPELTQIPDVLKPFLGSDNLVFDPSGVMQRVDALGQKNKGVHFSLIGAYPQVLSQLKGLTPIKYAFASGANNVGQIMSPDGLFVGGYEIKPLGNMMPFDALVSVVDNKVVGILSMSSREMGQGKQDATPAYNEGRRNWGVLIDLQSGEATPLLQSPKGIQTAESLGWVGQKLTVYSTQDGKRNIVVQPGMLFHIDVARKKVSIFEPGLKSKEKYLQSLQAQIRQAGGSSDKAMSSTMDQAQASRMQKSLLAIANIVMIAVSFGWNAGADAKSQSLEELRRAVIAQTVQQVEKGKEDSKRKQVAEPVVSKGSLTVKSQQAPAIAPVKPKKAFSSVPVTQSTQISVAVSKESAAMQESKEVLAPEAKEPLYNFPVAGKGAFLGNKFFASNVLIVWKSVNGKSSSQWVSREAMLGLDETISVTTKDGRVSYVSKDWVVSQAQELLILGGNGKTVGRVVKVYPEGYKVWSLSEAAANLKHYFMAIPKDGNAAVQFVPESQLQNNWKDLRWKFSEFQKIALVKTPKEGQSNTTVEMSIYPRFGESFAEAEVVTSVSDTELQITKAGDPNKVVANIHVKNEVEVGGQNVLIVERRLASGAIQKTYGSIVPRQSGKALSSDGKAGTLFVQLFATQFNNGNPVKGLAIVGYLEEDRDIFEFSVKEGKYSIGTKVIGKAARRPHLKLHLADVVRMFPVRENGSGEMMQVNPHVAEELDAKGKFLRAFFIDSETNEELGVINKIMYGEKGKDYYEVTAYPEKDKFVSYLMEGTQDVDGRISLKIVQKISSAHNLPPISLQRLQNLVGPLAGKLAMSVQAIAREIGIDFEKIQIVPSLKIAEGNGQNIFYRIKDDPLARIIVFQSTSNPEQSSYIVNTEFDDLKQSRKAYKWTLLGEINYVETTPKVFTLEQLNTRLGLNNVSDLPQYNDQLSYRRFTEFIEISEFWLPLGLNDETFKDKVLMRYVASGDPLALDQLKVEQTGDIDKGKGTGAYTVRIMKYGGEGSLRKLRVGADGKDVPIRDEENRPLTVVSGEVAVNPSEDVQAVIRVTEWVRNDPKGLYIYKSTYEKDAGGVDFSPGIEITYDFSTGGVREAFERTGYVFYSLDGIPLMNRSTEPSFWEMGRWFSNDNSKKFEKNQSAFLIKVKQEEGLVYRLVQEVNIPWTTPKSELMSTLYINGYPVAVQKGKEIRVNVFKPSWADVMRNGIPGKIMASVGLDDDAFKLGTHVLGFNIVYQNGEREAVNVNVKDVIQDLEATSQSGNGVHVLNVPAATIKSLVGEKEPYTSWLRDWVLQPEAFIIPVFYSVLMALFMWFKEPLRGLRRKRGGDRLLAKKGPPNANTLLMDRPDIAKKIAAVDAQRDKAATTRDAAQRFTDNTVLVQKLAVFMAANNTIVVKEYNKDQEAQEIKKAKERAFAIVKKLNPGVADTDDDQGDPQVQALKPIEITGGKDIAAERLEAVLRPALGFFNEQDIQDIKKAFKSGELIFDDVNVDPESDVGKVPKFDIKEIIRATRSQTSSLPVVALRYALDNEWISEDDLNVQIATILTSSEWQYEHGARWGELFSRVRLKLFEDAVKDPRRLNKTFPDPEVNMYRSLSNKGYTDLQSFVLDENNGATVKQRVERYTVQRILLPMVTQMRMEIPGLGSTMKDLRTAPFENNLISEFYRFAMINPEILPDAHYRIRTGEVYTFNDPSIFDVEYNVNPMMSFSEPNTFREKLVQTLLMMPLSDTDEISLGPVSAISPMTMFLTRRLIRDLQTAEQSIEDVVLLEERKTAILKDFKEHTRFWKGAFASSNWTSLLGTGLPTFGLFKRITEPGATQPQLFIKEIFHDEYMYYFFEQLQVQSANPYAEYDAIMNRIMHNDAALVEQLLLAYKSIGFLKGLVAKVGDPDFKSFYQKQVDDWEKDIKRLLLGVGINVAHVSTGLESERQRASAVDTKQVIWDESDRLRAAALASESLLWIIASSHNSQHDNEKLEDFVRGSFTNLLGPVLQKLKQLRFERNPYAHFVNELTTTWKGDRHMWLFRRIIPKYGIAFAEKWLGGMRTFSLFGKTIATFGLGLASAQFRESEFSRSRSAVNLFQKITSQEAATEKEAVVGLNALVVQRELYKESWVAAIVPRLSQEDQELYAQAKAGTLGNNGALWSRLNRRLIEAGFYLDAPLGIVPVDGQGRSIYKKQSSLENYYGIKSPWVRAAVVTTRVVLTGVAAAVGYFVTAGLGVILAGFAWAVLPRLLGKTKTDQGKRFWLSVTGMGIFNIALTAELLFGKFLAVKMLVAGTAVTAGLWVLLIPVALMTLYLYELGSKRASVYRNNVWLDYWKRRTIGIVSWFSFFPIKSGWWGQNNAGKFFGQVLTRLIKTQRERGVLLPAGMLIQDKLMEDFDKLSRHHLLHPEERRALEASVNFIAQYPDDEKIKVVKGEELKELLRLALAYEQALGAMRALPGYKEGKDIGSKGQGLVLALKNLNLTEALTAEQEALARQLVEMKRPARMITPQDPKAREQMYTNFEVMVLKKPREDAFARLQAVSTHEQAYNETATYPLEKYGLHGTGNIVGLREFMPKLRREFSEFLMHNKLTPEYLEKPAHSSHVILYNQLKKNGVITADGWVDAEFKGIPDSFRAFFLEIAEADWVVIQEILMLHKRPTLQVLKLKDGKLNAAYNNMNALPITLKKLVTTYRDSLVDPKEFPGKEHITQMDADWLTKRLQAAVDDMVISETSLLGYNLRKAFEMRENMLATLMEWGQKNREEEAIKSFAAMIRVAEESDDMVVLFRDWAKGRSQKVIKVAEEALSAFMNEILPNNISMVEDISEDVYYVHLSAAASYGDFEYYRMVQKMFRQYHSLKLASEQEPGFRAKFEQYQKSAKLKTTGMLQFGLIWASGNGFRLFEDFEKDKKVDPLILTPEEKEQYKYVALSWNGIPAAFKSKFRAILEDPEYGVKFAKSAKGREVVLVKDMRDYAKAFMRFRSENYVDILNLGAGSGFLSDTYEVMRYVEESARSEALIPFYDGRKDNLIPGNKNGGINMNVWMNYGRSWNMDAAVRGYLGQNLYRLLYASYVGRNPEVVIANPAFRVWSSTNDAYPGVQRYKVAQETFTQEVQSALGDWGTFYGKGGVFQPAGNAFFTTPGEDSANYIMSLTMYVDLVSPQFAWLVWDWGRPSLHTESIMGTEFRYVNNVTRFEMDTGLFELYLNPDVGYDMKLANDHMFNHYLFASVASALLILVPMMQGFSGFAFLAPIAVFVPLTFLAMQAINNLNFFRHWREEGSVLLMLFTGGRDIAKAFTYYVSMHTMFTKARLLASNETFRFVASVKTMLLGILDRTRVRNRPRWNGLPVKRRAIIWG